MAGNRAWRMVWPWLIVAVLALVVAVVIGQVGDAARVVAEPAAPNCMYNTCGVDGPCQSGDVNFATLTTIGVDDYCEYVGDTGVYYFRMESVANSNVRYDPGVWIATDGGDAITGTCYTDYLTPPLTTTAHFVPPWGPYLDAEDLPGSGDECGDIPQDTTVYKDTGPVTLQCTADNLDGAINACVAWDNNPGDNCPANSNCPGNGSKCRCEEIPFEVNLNVVDLAVTKSITPTAIPSNGEVDMVLTVSNEVYQSQCYTSTGYTIVDDLSIWFKVNGPLPADCTSDPDPVEVCNTNPGDYPNGCQGFGDVVTCIVTDDLHCSDPAPVITLPVQIWLGDPAVPASDPRMVDPPPSQVSNEACVAGFETDPHLANNCGDDTVPTAIDLKSFSASVEWRSVRLNWATTGEVDNLGFNLYRGTTVDGTRTKLNSSLIPSQVPPGSPIGAEYAFIDQSAQLGWRWERGRGLVWGTTYYYWLEDVDIYGNSSLTGPAESAVTGGPPIRFFPIRWPVGRED